MARRRPTVSRGALFLALACAAAPAAAQNEAIQRELLIRQQQSDAFALQLRQSQERLASPRGPALDANQLAARQRLENLSAQQLQYLAQPIPVDPLVANQLRAGQLDRAAQDRLIVLPPPVVHASPGPRTEETPRPLPSIEQSR